MRKPWLVVFTAVCLLGAPSVAPAGQFTPGGTFVGAVNAQLAALVAQYPGGGPQLCAAIAAAVRANPSLADDAVFLARTSNPAQAQAIGCGCAQAAAALAAAGNTAGAARIAFAMQFADPITLAAYSAAAGTDLAGLGQGPGAPNFIPGIGTSGVSGGGCPSVSPASPGCF